MTFAVFVDPYASETVAPGMTVTSFCPDPETPNGPPDPDWTADPYHDHEFDESAMLTLRSIHTSTSALMLDVDEVGAAYGFCCTPILTPLRYAPHVIAMCPPS